MQTPILTQTYTKQFQINKLFLEAMILLQQFYNSQHNFSLQFCRFNSKILISNWNDSSNQCQKFQLKFQSILQHVNIMKINQHQKKIQRIKNMKKWRKQYHISGLNIMCVKKNFGNVYYLIGCGSHFQIYQVLKNLQTHTYKSYQSSFCKFIYKQIFMALFESVSYQRDAFDKFKITSSEIKLFQSKSKSKRQIKFLQFMFQLDQYMSSVSFIEKYKKFLQDEYQVIGLVIQKQLQSKLIEQIKNMRFCAYTVVQRKSQMYSTVYIVGKKKEIADKISRMEIHNEGLDQLIIGLRFLKGIGKTYEKLKSANLEGQSHDVQLSQLGLVLKNNFVVERNMIKNQFEIKITKNQLSNSSYCQLISKLL